MEKKIACVTGASRGIGKAIAIELAKNDYFVAINYRSREEEARDVLETIQKEGGNGMIIQSDVADFEQAGRMIETIQKEYGNIDVLVNNAGITKDTLMLRMDEETFSSVIDVNLKGTYNCIKHVTRSMFKQRYGVIINMSSVVGLTGNAGQANYAASKAGVIGLTKSLAKEYAPRGIRVNAVAPGFIDTEMTQELKEDIQATIKQQIPLNDFGKPEDVARLVRFLVSEDARYITGQTIAVDGGMTM